ncbi:hypothetical protein IZT14_002733 [Clostridium perfringens]|nr:hypothetical protein [Clostridium perfringens]HBI6919886.1 hypothetical protein [Clostridium perfringens]HBI7039781.1 hypothetical protein [Clostridium perfringens]
MFTKNELDWIKELVEDKIFTMKEKDNYNFFEYDKEIFESILKKCENGEKE